jgi:hypothetical protein
MSKFQCCNKCGSVLLTLGLSHRSLSHRFFNLSTGLDVKWTMSRRPFLMGFCLLSSVLLALSLSMVDKMGRTNSVVLMAFCISELVRLGGTLFNRRAKTSLEITPEPCLASILKLFSMSGIMTYRIIPQISVEPEYLLGML